VKENGQMKTLFGFGLVMLLLITAYSLLGFGGHSLMPLGQVLGGICLGVPAAVWAWRHFAATDAE
jgi:hypothetical protein